jgi:hypothetical protein
LTPRQSTSGTGSRGQAGRAAAPTEAQIIAAAGIVSGDDEITRQIKMLNARNELTRGSQPGPPPAMRPPLKTRPTTSTTTGFPERQTPVTRGFHVPNSTSRPPTRPSSPAFGRPTPLATGGGGFNTIRYPNPRHDAEISKAFMTEEELFEANYIPRAPSPSPYSRPSSPGPSTYAGRPSTPAPGGRSRSNTTTGTGAGEREWSNGVRPIPIGPPNRFRDPLGEDRVAYARYFGNKP